MKYLDMQQAFNEKFNVGATAFGSDYKAACEIMDHEIQTVNEARLKEKVSNSLKSLRDGIKSKEERVLQLQSLFDDTVADIQRGTHKQEKIVQGKAVTYDRRLTPSEINSYRHTAKAIISDISRIEGDFAPTRIIGDNVLDGITRDELMSKVDFYIPTHIQKTIN